MSYMRHTTWQRLYQAVSALASAYNINKRIEYAFSALCPLKTDEFPQELQEKFEELKRELTKVEGSGDEGNVAATIKCMSDEELEMIAKKIVDMYDTIATKYCSG